ncbi:hypothetical protein Tco_0058968 [Tanacetum coccineum]
MTIQSNVKEKILATSSEMSKVENARAEMLRKANVVTDALSRKERVKPRRVPVMAMTILYGVLLVGSVMVKAHASRLRWTIYPVLLADDEESVRDAIGFESLYYGRDWRTSSLIGPDWHSETIDKYLSVEIAEVLIGCTWTFHVSNLRRLEMANLLMSSASSAVTYTSVYTDSAPGRVFWGADEEVSDGGTPRVIPEYPEYLVPSEDEAPMEDQPLPADASPAALSPGYVPDSDPEEDPEEDSEEEHADYPADGGDGDDEPSDDDSDDDTDDDEEPFEDEEDDEEEEEHPAPADSSAIPVVDLVPSAGDTEAFETDESAPTPRPPQIRIPFAQTRLRRARKTVRPEPPMSASMEARIAEHAAAPTPPLPVASPPLPLPSPLTTSPTDAGAPLGYRAAGIRMRAVVASPPLSLPPTSYRTDVPEAEMPPRKRACLTTPAPGYEIGKSSTAGAGDSRATQRQRTEEFEVRFEEAHDDRAYLNARVNSLFRDRPYHRHTALALDREAVYARIAWTSSEERSAAIEAHVRTLEAQVATLIARTSSLQTRLTTALGRIATLEARDPEPQDGPAEAGSSC